MLTSSTSAAARSIVAGRMSTPESGLADDRQRVDGRRRAGPGRRSWSGGRRGCRRSPRARPGDRGRPAAPAGRSRWRPDAEVEGGRRLADAALLIDDRRHDRRPLGRRRRVGPPQQGARPRPRGCGSRGRSANRRACRRAGSAGRSSCRPPGGRRPLGSRGVVPSLLSWIPLARAGRKGSNEDIKTTLAKRIGRCQRANRGEKGETGVRSFNCRQHPANGAEEVKAPKSDDAVSDLCG